MIKITEHVPANQIWPTATSYVDNGLIRGLVRGYNFEVKTKDGKFDWLSTTWIDEDPEKYLNSEWMQWYANEHQWTYTGRVCFRGYGEEKYDPKERDTYICNIRQCESAKKEADILRSEDNDDRYEKESLR